MSGKGKKKKQNRQINFEFSIIICTFSPQFAKTIMTYEQFWQPLTSIYDTGEARAVARWLLEVVFSINMTDIVCGAVEQLPPNDAAKLLDMQQRLLKGEPVQYVAGVADFGPHQLHVAPGVLIPRPETYELCQWITDDVLHDRQSLHILDIGTGSGCIACTLAAAIPQAHVSAWDLSEKALGIAQQNAQRMGVEVTFEQVDILSKAYDPSSTYSGSFDMIVSNPPYICRKEALTMEKNVLEHEPDMALFVPDDDALLFYRAIADFATKALCEQGCLYFELNPIYATDTQTMLAEKGFTHCEIREDQFGKQRMLKAWR